jgi:hypothetical protein
MHPVVPMPSHKSRFKGTCDVLCRVKRSGYELVVAPMRSPTCVSWEQVHVQVHLNQRGQTWEYILTCRDLEAFCQDLGG